MGPDASTGPPRSRVERTCETNRLAKDFQARAYEELLPIIRRGPRRAPETEPVAQKGVAA
jgi:hypothetical protein